MAAPGQGRLGEPRARMLERRFVEEEIMVQTAAAAKVVPSRTKPTFQWDDPFLLDDQLSEDERLVVVSHVV